MTDRCLLSGINTAFILLACLWIREGALLFCVYKFLNLVFSFGLWQQFKIKPLALCVSLQANGQECSDMSTSQHNSEPPGSHVEITGSIRHYLKGKKGKGSHWRDTIILQTGFSQDIVEDHLFLIQNKASAIFDKSVYSTWSSCARHCHLKHRGKQLYRSEPQSPRGASASQLVPSSEES